jgi:DNA-binding transcriptional LysR family regulator
MNRIETREIAQFIAVAEELHFGRAAERLAISQPSLSRTIRQLEIRLGVPLLERTSRRVALTVAGEILLIEGRLALQVIDDAAARIRRVNRARPLRLAANAGTGPGTLRALVASYEQTTPAAALEMVFTRDPAGALREDAADIAIVCLTERLEGLVTLELDTERPCALVRADDPLADRRELTVAELRSDPRFVERCPGTALDEIVNLVALGRLIVLVGHRAADRTGSDVAAIPVPDLPPSSVALAWPERSSHPRTADLVRAALEVREEPTPGIEPGTPSLRVKCSTS